MSDIKRYYLNCAPQSWVEMSPSGEGGWVYYEDHIAALEAVKAERAACVIVTDEMVTRFASVYYGGGVPHLMTDIRAGLTRALETSHETLWAALAEFEDNYDKGLKTLAGADLRLFLADIKIPKQDGRAA